MNKKEINLKLLEYFYDRILENPDKNFGEIFVDYFYPTDSDSVIGLTESSEYLSGVALRFGKSSDLWRKIHEN